MWRRLHSALGLISVVLVLALSVSGAILAIFPVLNSLQASPIGAAATVADIAGPLADTLSGIVSIKVSPSGQIVVDYSDTDGLPLSGVVDPTSGAVTQALPKANNIYATLKDFHRSFLMGDNGRIAAGVGASAIALMSLSGLILLVSRMGGWRRLFDRPKGRPAARIHTALTRVALLPIMVSSITAVYLVMAQFEVVTVQEAASIAYPESVQGQPRLSAGQFAGLAAVPLKDLIRLEFPFSGDIYDVFKLRTAAGLTIIDQFTGEVLETVPATRSEQINNWFYALHTGEGLAWLGAMLGLSAALVPAISLSGLVIRWRRRQGNGARVHLNVTAAKAQIVILVGSEGGSTWGFAAALHRNLTATGKTVHLGTMNDFSGRYHGAEQVLFLTATYGDGKAPKSATKALDVLERQVSVPRWRYGVLGFGDRAFPKFCQFAKYLDLAMADRGWPALLPATWINRQSTQAFANWGNDLGRTVTVPLVLTHQIALPPTQALTLVSRDQYGALSQAQTVVLRFRTSRPAHEGLLHRIMQLLGGAARFAPTDLLGVLPPGETVPRYYSIASATSQTEVEICVRKLPGGRCSTFLHDLQIAEQVDAFVRTNPDFSLPSVRRPVILISAATGIAPFAGMIRDNRRKQPLHLFWGGRSSDNDFLYRDMLQTAETTGQLASLTTAFSRSKEGFYVQDRLRADAARLADLVHKGAAIMVCGGDAMAQAVRAEFEAILQPMGMSVHALKLRGRYLEDVF
jgi:sulfite reductase (NADPH) flavoprotein alpha-component